MLNALTREELFLLVWERPSQEIAKELGISDVALGKRCKKLQVPKPPPGYWAMVKAGKRPRKPLLKEFSEQLSERQKRKVRRREIKRDSVRLLPLQAQLFHRAVNELSAAGVDLGELEITKTGVRSLSSDAATQTLLLIQKRYLKWLDERPNSGPLTHPSIRSIQSLVSKLLPLANHILCFSIGSRRNIAGIAVDQRSLFDSAQNLYNRSPISAGWPRKTTWHIRRGI